MDEVQFYFVQSGSLNTVQWDRYSHLIWYENVPRLLTLTLTESFLKKRNCVWNISGPIRLVLLLIGVDLYLVLYCLLTEVRKKYSSGNRRDPISFGFGRDMAGCLNTRRPVFLEREGKLQCAMCRRQMRR